MNKLYYILVTAFTCLLFFSSCDNTLDLVEPGKDVPVVYSLLSSGTTQQIIRVEKGFIDPLIPASEIAQLEDSVYYKDAIVSVINLETNNRYTFEKIPSSSLGIQREEGFFPTEPNYIYVYNGETTDFRPGNRVRFELDRGDNFDVVFSEINLLDTLLVTRPLATDAVNMPDLADFTVKWVFKGDVLPRAYSVNLHITYEEANTDDTDPEFVSKTISWAFQDVKDQDFASREGKEFYQFMSSVLEEDPKYVRTFEWFDVEIIYTGEEVQNYIDFLSANTGITSSQPIPPYSNLSEGLGIIGERNVQRVNRVYLKEASLDSLSNGRYTKNLGFL